MSTVPFTDSCPLEEVVKIWDRGISKGFEEKELKRDRDRGMERDRDRGMERGRRVREREAGVKIKLLRDKEVER
jgi:hypothetical protein